MDAAELRSQRLTNRSQTIALLAGMAGLLGLCGWALAGGIGLAIALAAVVGVAIFGARVSPAVVLRMYRAVPIPVERAPDLHALHTELSRRAELEHVPALYYVPSRMLNAFAVGTDRDSAVAFTDGLLRVMRPRELAGVLAHELSHIRHRDTAVMGLADVVTRFTGTLSQIGQLMLIPALVFGKLGISLWGLGLLIVAPIVAGLLQLALSRSREFNADVGAAELTGDPAGLASALTRLERAQPRRTLRGLVLPGRQPPMPGLLRTHPPTDERVRRLMAATPPAPREPLWPRGARRLTPGVPRVRQGPSWHLFGPWY